MFLNNPNLPQKKVNSVLIDYRAEKAKKALEDMNIKVYLTPNTNIAYPAISGHADIAFHILNEKYAVAAPEVYDYYCSLFGKEHIIMGKHKIKSTYPGDIAYNIARIGKIAFHYKKYTDNIIFEYYKQNGVKLINVKQGYSKCSVCIVSEKAIITQDKSIAQAAIDNNIDALLISEGQIKLKGFPYGFIGGATGLISRETLVCSGNAENHPDYCRIKAFCNKYGVNVCSLYDDILEDIGSIIPIN